jgi:hypothetical protein
VADRRELKRRSDPKREAHRILLIRWRTYYQGGPVTSAQIRDLMAGDARGGDALDLRDALESLIPGRGGKAPTVQRIGSALAGMAGSVRGGLVLERGMQQRDGVEWRVMEAEGSDGDEGGR